MKTLLLPLALLTAAPAFADVTTTPIAGTELDVSATGRSTRAPDIAAISAGVVTQALKAGDAMAANAKAMTATIAALKHAGVSRPVSRKKPSPERANEG